MTAPQFGQFLSMQVTQLRRGSRVLHSRQMQKPSSPVFSGSLAFHDDLLSIGGPGRLESGLVISPLPPEPSGHFNTGSCNLRATQI